MGRNQVQGVLLEELQGVMAFPGRNILADDRPFGIIGIEALEARISEATGRRAEPDAAVRLPDDAFHRDEAGAAGIDAGEAAGAVDGVHDVCSALHPLGVASPFFRELPLAQHGLEWVFPPACLAHPLDDGTAVLVEGTVEQTAANLGPDAAAYRRLVGPLVAGWQSNPLCLQPQPRPRPRSRCGRPVADLAAWQRCRVHFMRNLLAKIPHRDQAAVAAAARLIFDQPSLPSAQIQLHLLGDRLGRAYPEAAKLLETAREIYSQRDDKIGGMTFLPAFDAQYDQMPYEEIGGGDAPAPPPPPRSEPVEASRTGGQMGSGAARSEQPLWGWPAATSSSFASSSSARSTSFPLARWRKSMRMAVSCDPTSTLPTRSG